VVDFDVIFRSVLRLTFACGALAVAVAVLATVIPMPLAGQLVSAFTDTFKLGVAAILGLIGGHGQSRGRR
jgi:hypothetical protein